MAEFDAESRWCDIREKLKSEYGSRTFDSWLRPIDLVEVEGDCAVLSLPSHFTADWVRSHFAERLRLLWAAGKSGVESVRITVGAPVLAANPAPDDDRRADAAGLTDDNAPPIFEIRAPDSEMPLDARYTFDSFVLGKANELAHGAAKAMAAEGPTAFNPLFLHGTTGVGKTHLMHAIGWELLRRSPAARIVYMSAEKFMVEFLQAMRAKDTLSFKARLRSADLLLIDDVQFIGGKDTTQEEMFHTMNEVIAAGRPLVISADRSPQNLEGIEARIRSRLSWGLVADINPAEYELRLNILHEKLKRMPGASVPDDVIDFLARKITSNVRELEGALNRIVAYATLTGRTIDVDFTRQQIAETLRAHTKRVSIDRIQREVADFYTIKLSDMMSARRARDVARPRQIAMYLAKRLTPRSLPDIGRRFGGRDHTTVMHAVKRIEQLRSQDGELSADIERLERLIDA